MKRTGRRNGWTLIEVLIAVVLCSLLLGSILGAMVQMRLEEEVGSRRLDALESAQAFLEQLTDDVQHASPVNGASPSSWIACDGGEGGEPVELTFERWSDEPGAAPDARMRVRYLVRPAPADAALSESVVERVVEGGGAAPRVTTFVAGILRECRLRVRSSEATPSPGAAAGAPGRTDRVWLEMEAVIESAAVESRRNRLPLHVQIVPRELNRGLRAHWIGGAS